MFALVITTGLVVSAPALKDDPPPAGEWEMERFEANGEPRGLARNVSLTERSFGYDYGGRTQQRAIGVNWKATFFRVAGERQADLVRAQYKWDDDVVEKAIWKLEGDRLTICIGPAGGPRPTDYSTTAESARTLIVLKRVRD